MKKRSLLAGVGAILTSLLVGGCNPPGDRQIFFDESFDESDVQPGETLLTTGDDNGMNGAFIVPGVGVSPTATSLGVSTTATGTGSFIVNRSTGDLRGTVVVTGVSSEEIDEVIIDQGELGEPSITNVPVLRLVPTSDLEFRVPASTQLSNANVTALLRGNFFVEVHTLDHPHGEIRGQLLTSDFDALTFELRTQNVVGSNFPTDSVCNPDSTPPLKCGRAFVLIDNESQTLDITVRFVNLNGIVGVNVHRASEGVKIDGAAQPVLTLGVDQTTGLWRTPAPVVLPDSIFADLLAGRLAIKAEASPDVRGQILP